MSGVAVIVSLLKASTPITNVVAAARIMAGDLPLNTVLPAIAVTQVDSIPNNFINVNAPNKMHSDRVQVSVLCKGPQTAAAGTGWVGVRALLKLVLAACPNQRGTVNGVALDSIVPADEGPDLYDDETALYSSSRDFFVRWVGA